MKGTSKGEFKITDFEGEKDDVYDEESQNNCSPTESGNGRRRRKGRIDGEEEETRRRTLP